MQKIITSSLSITLFIFLMSGCAEKIEYIEKGFSRNFSECEANNVNDKGAECITKPYQGNHKIIVGSVQDDSRVIYSTGKILKTWIAPYHQGETLIASHSNYIVVEKPKFIVGESVMPEGRFSDGVASPTGAIPMIYRDEELDRTPIKKQYSNKNIKKYIENVDKSKNYANVPAKNRYNKAKGTYDKEIMDFIKE